MASKSGKLWTDAFYQAVNPEVVFAGFQRAQPGWTARTTRSLIEDFDLWYVVQGGGAVRIDGRWVEFQKGEGWYVPERGVNQPGQASLDAIIEMGTSKGYTVLATTYVNVLFALEGEL